MPQPGHNPHGYNPVNYQRHYHWVRLDVITIPMSLSISHDLDNLVRIQYTKNRRNYDIHHYISHD